MLPEGGRLSADIEIHAEIEIQIQIAPDCAYDIENDGPADFDLEI